MAYPFRITLVHPILKSSLCQSLLEGYPLCDHFQSKFSIAILEWLVFLSPKPEILRHCLSGRTFPFPILAYIGPVYTFFLLCPQILIALLYMLLYMLLMVCQVLQLDLFENCEISIIRDDVKKLKVSQDRVRKGIYAKHGELQKKYDDLLSRVELLERYICRGAEYEQSKI